MTYLPPVNGGRINASIGGNTAGAGALISSGTLTLAGGNNITLSQNGNAVTISGGVGGGIALANSQTVYTSGTANLNVAGGALTIASTAGQSFNFSVPQTSSLSATGAVSISASGGTISIGAPAQTVQTQNMQNVALSGNTAGVMAQISSGTLTLAGGNNITISQNGNAVTISGGAGGGAFSAGISNLGNTSGMSGTVANQIVLAGGNNVTLSQSTDANGATVSVVGAAGGGNPQHSFYQNLVPQNSAQPYTTLAIPFKSMLVQPLSPIEGYGFPGDMTISTLMMNMSGSQTATSAASAWSSSFSSSVSFGVYWLANSSQLTLVNSASTSWSAPANSQNSTIWAGPRFLTFHSSQWSTTPVLSYGERYWYGVIHNSSNFSNMGPSWLGQYVGASTQRSGTIGVSQAVNTSQGMVPFLGIYSASLSSMPGSIANSQINKVNASAGFAPAVILNATISAF